MSVVSSYNGVGIIKFFECGENVFFFIVIKLFDDVFLDFGHLRTGKANEFDWFLFSGGQSADLFFHIIQVFNLKEGSLTLRGLVLLVQKFGLFNELRAAIKERLLLQIFLLLFVDFGHYFLNFFQGFRTLQHGN